MLEFTEWRARTGVSHGIALPDRISQTSRTNPFRARAAGRHTCI
jgi:hypothetical protein